jgi:hypothetical protein
VADLHHPQLAEEHPPRPGRLHPAAGHGPEQLDRVRRELQLDETHHLITADVQPIPASSGGGHALAFTRPGEWTDYTFNAASDKAGRYDLILRYAVPLDGGAFRLELDGKAITAPKPAFATGGWQTYGTLAFYDMSIPVGTHVLRLAR